MLAARWPCPRPASSDAPIHSLLVSSDDAQGAGIVEGTYQSPILVQWQQAPRSSRVLDVRLTELI